MKVANIFPVNSMYFMEDQNINMLLTHLALNNESYKEYAKYLSSISYTILDNSLIENNNKSLKFEDVLDVADYICPHEVVLVDVYQDKEATKKAVLDCIKLLHKRYGDNIPFKLMAVAHGTTYDDIAEMISFYETIYEISTIGIPKYLAKCHPLGRPYFESAWSNSTKDIHLLGLYYSFEELGRYQYPDKIRSVDTCLVSYFIHNDLPYDSVRAEGHTIDLVKTIIPKKIFDAWVIKNGKEISRKHMSNVSLGRQKCQEYK